MLYMGIDVGSSGCKVSVVDEIGKTVCFAERRYSFEFRNGNSELDPNLVTEQVMLAIKEVASDKKTEDLATISVTSFGEMFVLLDEDRKVLANSISYNDQRGREEAEELSRDLGDDTVYSITGTTVNAMYSLPKLMWIRKHRPEVYKKTKKVCLFADFILIKLGAEFHIEYSLAARTLLFDVKNKCWSREIFERTGIDPDKFSNPVPAGTTVGRIDGKIADELGLPKNVILLAGGHDQCCAALGAGIISPGKALDSMGSNECIVPCFKGTLINNTMRRYNMACIPFVLPDTYVTYAFNRTCGTVLDWYRVLIGNISYEEMYEEMDDKPSKQLFLPHFAGAATPYMDDDASGVLAGLDLTATRKQITKSIIEGLNYEMLVNLSCLKEAGFDVRNIYVSGGMSQNDKVLQIKADIFGFPVHKLTNSQTGTVAMAVLGSVAMKTYGDIPTAVGNIVKITKTFEPEPARNREYREIFEKYKRMYTAMKTIRNGINY